MTPVLALTPGDVAAVAAEVEAQARRRIFRCAADAVDRALGEPLDLRSRVEAVRDMLRDESAVARPEVEAWLEVFAGMADPGSGAGRETAGRFLNAFAEVARASGDLGLAEGRVGLFARLVAGVGDLARAWNGGDAAAMRAALVRVAAAAVAWLRALDVGAK